MVFFIPPLHLLLLAGSLSSSRFSPVKRQHRQRRQVAIIPGSPRSATTRVIRGTNTSTTKQGVVAAQGAAVLAVVIHRVSQMILGTGTNTVVVAVLLRLYHQPQLRCPSVRTNSSRSSSTIDIVNTIQRHRQQQEHHLLMVR